MLHHPYKALYIHIPFCASKCAYCDFDSYATRQDDPCIQHYIESLITQIRTLSKQGECAGLETIYIGGGTPTHIGSKHLSSLLYALSISIKLDQISEFCVEANPESVTDALIKDIWALGVNRISLGVQSFHDQLLTTLNRPHTAAQAKEAIARVQTRFTNVSIDLMCGLPSQTREMFLADVHEAIRLGVKHISVYPLTVEKNTPLYKQRKHLTLPDEDLQASMLEDAEAALVSAGFSRYEVASYAHPGYESKHNSAYWTGVPYLGVGQSAVTMTQNDERRMRVRNNQVEDDLSAQEMAAEDAMLAMRMARGLEKDRLQVLQGQLPHLLEILQKLARIGLVEETEEAWKPTHKGWLQGNQLYAAVLFCEDQD